MGLLAHSILLQYLDPLSKLGALADVCLSQPNYIRCRGVLGVLLGARPAVDVDHFLLAHEVIGALRAADCKEESSDGQGRASLAYYEKGASYV